MSEFNFSMSNGEERSGVSGKPLNSLGVLKLNLVSGLSLNSVSVLEMKGKDIYNTRSTPVFTLST